MSGILDIAISGLNAASSRVANAVSNIVNASSTGKLPTSTQPYTGYTPTDIVSLSNAAGGVTTQTIARNPAYTSAFDPTSANANPQGLVAAPNEDIASELVATIPAKASYSASAVVVKTVEKLDQALLDIKT